MLNDAGAVPKMAAAIAIPLAAFVHSLGYYGARSATWRMSYEVFDAPIDSMSTLFAAANVASLVGTLAALLVGALLGPAPTAALGLAIYAAGAFVQAVAPNFAVFGTGTLISGAGIGLYRPAMIVACTRPFGRGWEPARAAVLLAVYGATNLAALPSSLASSAADVLGAVGGQVMAGLSGAMSLGAAVLFGGLFAVGALAPASVAAEADDQRLDLPFLGVAGGTALVGGGGLALWSLASNFQWAAMSASSDRLQSMWTLNPIVVLLVCTFGVLALLAAQFMNFRLPVMAIGGVGLLLSALGLLPSFLASQSGVLLLGVMTVVGAIGEALTWGPIAARACGEVHFRAAIVPAVVIASAGIGPSLLSRGFDALGVGVELGGAGASVLGIGVAVAGGILLVAAWPAQSWLAASAPVDAGDDEEE